MTDTWRYLGMQVFRKNGPRDDRVMAPIINSPFVRVEVVPLVRLSQWPDWYRAGWINPVAQFGARRLILPSQVVPLIGPSALPMPTERPYRVRFAPVPWLPPCRVLFYYLLDPPI